MEINFKDYLDEEEIKDIVNDELRLQIRKHFDNEKNAERLISNLCYGVVQEEVEKFLPNHLEVIGKKVASLINNKDLSFYVFRTHYSSGAPESAAMRIIEQTVNDNKELLQERVIQTITEKDYADDAWCKFERLAEEFTGNVYDFVEKMRQSTAK